MNAPHLAPTPETPGRGAALLSDLFALAIRALAFTGRSVPSVRRRLKRLRCARNLSYGPHGRRNLLDIYRPVDPPPGPQPTVLYFHGGGFRVLSKETHWSLALRFVERGYTVVVPNYRRAKEARCPAAHEDAARALEWCLDHAEREAFDPEHFILAGESAGGNLCLAITLLCLESGPTPWARRLFERGWSPAAQLPACPFAQVVAPERYEGQLRPLYYNRIRFLSHCYLSGEGTPEIDALAEPLLRLESPEPLSRPLPPTFLSVGGRDPILNDSERCAVALRERGASLRYFVAPNGHHAFQASLWGPSASLCWAETWSFLAEHKLLPEKNPDDPKGL